MSDNYTTNRKKLSGEMPVFKDGHHAETGINQ